MKDKTTIISIMLIFFCVGAFVGFIFTTIYIKNVFKEEITVSVTPIGWTYHPYTNIRQKGVIDRQDFRVYFKNGFQVFDEWEGYSYE